MVERQDEFSRPNNETSNNINDQISKCGVARKNIYFSEYSFFGWSILGGDIEVILDGNYILKINKLKIEMAVLFYLEVFWESIL